MKKTFEHKLKLDNGSSVAVIGSGPAGCNHCGGIVSESLVQLLTTEGINIPTKVAQKGIESYVLHMDVGSVRIETPVHEKRIAAMTCSPKTDSLCNFRI